MILTITPNPALDVTYSLPLFEPGETNRVEHRMARAGGKGINVARVVRQAGRDVRAVVLRGGETGRRLVADLDASGIPHLDVPVAGETRTTVTVVATSSNQTTVLNEPGPQVTGSEVDALRAQVATAASSARCVVVSGSLPPGVPPDLGAWVVAEAHRASVPAIVDTSGSALIVAARAGADLLKPNAAELREALGEADPVAGGRTLLGLGARRVFVSLGADGMIGLDAEAPEHPVHARYPHALLGNPTGAGDAAVAAAAVCFADAQNDLTQMLRLCVAWSAAAVPVPVAGELVAEFREFEPLVISSPIPAGHPDRAVAAGLVTKGGD